MAKIIGNTTATPNPKPDWNQNDETKANYIENKPAYAAIEEVNYTRFPYKSNPACEVIPGPEGSGYVMVKGKRLGLLEEETYEVDIYYHTHMNSVESDDTLYYSDNFICQKTTEDNWSAFGLLMPSGATFISDFWMLDIYDGVIFNEDGEVVPGEGYIYYIGDLSSYSEIYSFKVHNLPSVDYIYHKLDNNLLDVDMEFDGDSPKPQSGIAVSNAMAQAVDRAKPYISETLGDKHIKSVYDYKQNKTYLYTEGIGLNTNLKTNSKKTLVDAINELANGPNINGDNLATFNDNNQCYIYKFSREDINDSPLSVKYDFNVSDTRLSYISAVSDGYIEIQCGKTSQWIYVYHCSNKDNTKKQLYTLQPDDELWNVIRDPNSTVYCITVQNIETSQYITNLFVKSSSDSDYTQWSVKENEVKKRDVVSFSAGDIIFGASIDSSNTYYSEYQVEPALMGNLQALIVDENDFIVTDDTKVNVFVYISQGTPWRHLNNSVVINNNKVYYDVNYASAYQAINTQAVIDKYKNIITTCCTNVCKYGDYLAVIKAKSASNYVLCLIETDNNTIVSEIPLISSSYNFDKLIIINDYIYIFGYIYDSLSKQNIYSSYAGKINDSKIHLNSRQVVSSLTANTYKVFDDRILAIPYVNNFSSPFCISLKKELPFNETDTDQTFNPESTLPQSGKAVAEALSGVNGIKYITEDCDAWTLDDGVYIIADTYPMVTLQQTTGRFVSSGTLIISGGLGCYKAITFIGENSEAYEPYTTQFYVNELGVVVTEREFIDKNYVDEQIAALQAQTQVPKNVEKHYRTEFDVASLNHKSITHSNANRTSVLNPLSFRFFKSLISDSKTQVIIDFVFISTFTDTVSGEKYAIFSNSPSDANFITDMKYIITMDGQSVSAPPDELVSLFKDALPSDALVKHNVYCQEGAQNAVAYSEYRNEIYVETSDSTTMDALWSELEPLLQQITHIAIDFKEVDIETKEGELIYE